MLAMSLWIIFFYFILKGASLKINAFCFLYLILSSFTHQNIVSRQKNICRTMSIQPIRSNVVLRTTFLRMDKNDLKHFSKYCILWSTDNFYFWVNNTFKMAEWISFEVHFTVYYQEIWAYHKTSSILVSKGLIELKTFLSESQMGVY